MIGLGLGSFAAGKMMPMGRRITMMISSVIGIVGVTLTLVLNFYLFNIGRIMYGFAAGAQQTVGVRMIIEFMPLERQSTCIAIFSTA